jgi:hypothetical protein
MSQSWSRPVTFSVVPTSGVPLSNRGECLGKDFVQDFGDRGAQLALRTAAAVGAT